MNLEALKQLRKSKKISLMDMADALGLQTAGGYSRLESGENKIKAEQLPAIAEKLEINLDSLTALLFYDQNIEQYSS